MLPRPPPSPLFPYTTLFRSIRANSSLSSSESVAQGRVVSIIGKGMSSGPVLVCGVPIGLIGGSSVSLRSEEHTSELQSHHDLVCRLLLEKKKTKINNHSSTL